MYAFKFIALLSIAVAFVSAETLAKKPKEPKESKCDAAGKFLILIPISKGTLSTVKACSAAGALAKKKKLSASDKQELGTDIAECVFEAVSAGLEIPKDCKDCAGSE
ncbi:hypothetical protein BDQ17DRAFT_1334700 [Cyathus striatus]|nr:hypothetical protein BDQ17DRAFT_1336392 [Cyathus striatus]KAF8988081.1 hypothetical protein BDQ17DRAFT_1435202 [Cyathus striatus]KAF8988082.1 hypothetical protein BDQ17DRAFT_1334700 [Cyathus striatus]